MKRPPSRRPTETQGDCRHLRIAAAIDRMEWEPVHRKVGAGRSECQWSRTHVNCRSILGYTYFPSPYAKLAGLDDSLHEHYSVFTGSLRRDDVEGAEVHSGIEEDDAFFLRFPTVEDAVAFCLDDSLAPMVIELYRSDPDPEPELATPRGAAPADEGRSGT